MRHLSDCGASGTDSNLLAEISRFLDGHVTSLKYFLLDYKRILNQLS